MEILVFKTNAQQPLYYIEEHLSAIKGIHSWSFDLEDTDRILRVKNMHASAREIELAVELAGFECEELE